MMDRGIQLKTRGELQAMRAAGLVLADATLGLGLIAGTTRITNFAYGESITFGALFQ